MEAKSVIVSLQCSRRWPVRIEVGRKSWRRARRRLKEAVTRLLRCQAVTASSLPRRRSMTLATEALIFALRLKDLGTFL